jgi:hypothetical protein
LFEPSLAEGRTEVDVVPTVRDLQASLLEHAHSAYRILGDVQGSLPRRTAEDQGGARNATVIIGSRPECNDWGSHPSFIRETVTVVHDGTHPGLSTSLSYASAPCQTADGAQSRSDERRGNLELTSNFLLGLAQRSGSLHPARL